MAYYFFMGETLLPVPPSKLRIKINNNNKTLNLINDGEVNILKNQGLTEISFEALLPNAQYPFGSYFYGFRPAEYFLNMFKNFKVNYSPFQFIVCRMTPGYEFLFDTNVKVALEDYDMIEDAENGLDAAVSVRLKQYKPYMTKTLDVKTNSDGTTTATVNSIRESSRETPDVYKVIGNQTLFEICKSKLGDGSVWQEIAKLNNITDPNNLTAGQVINFVR